MKATDVIRRIPIDFADLFRQAGIKPVKCSLARSKVADAWCLFVEEKDGVTLHVVNPPPLQSGETGVRILGNCWAFTA